MYIFACYTYLALGRQGLPFSLDLADNLYRENSLEEITIDIQGDSGGICNTLRECSLC